ncbi:DUF308 domain-containing protein [Nocardia inohanensis]|uniref:DUF308 domain-containing protein n=1 Tax=Nocardia inohanensis TaxID=209246 RepID=UPI001471515B|nr:DUF308 domain-containing protein [Nocardia inohanensis]
MPTNRIEGRITVFADWAWQALLVSGACSVLLGVVTVVWPNKSDTVLGILAGLVLLATAAVQLVVAFGANIATPLKVLEFAAGAAAFVLALWSFSSGQWISLLSLWIGMGWMVRGIAQAIAGAWSEQHAGSGRQEVLGLVTAALGMILAIGPFQTPTAFSIAVGFCVAALGVSEILTAAQLVVPEQSRGVTGYPPA